MVTYRYIRLIQHPFSIFAVNLYVKWKKRLPNLTKRHSPTLEMQLPSKLMSTFAY